MENEILYFEILERATLKFFWIVITNTVGVKECFQMMLKLILDHPLRIILIQLEAHLIREISCYLEITLAIRSVCGK